MDSLFILEETARDEKTLLLIEIRSCNDVCFECGIVTPQRSGSDWRIGGAGVDSGEFRSSKQKRCRVVATAKQWVDRIRVRLLRGDANEAQINGILRRVRRAMAKRPDYRPLPEKPFCPVWANRATLGAQAVWVFEAATPGVLSGMCGNLSPEEGAAIEERDKERCLQRVVVVQAKAPFKVQASYDSTA